MAIRSSVAWRARKRESSAACRAIPTGVVGKGVVAKKRGVARAARPPPLRASAAGATSKPIRNRLQSEDFMRASDPNTFVQRNQRRYGSQQRTHWHGLAVTSPLEALSPNSNAQYAASVPRAWRRPRRADAATTSGRGEGIRSKCPARRPAAFWGAGLVASWEKSPEQTAARTVPEPAPAIAAKRGGYFQNFDNYRNGASPAEPKSAVEAKVAAHFAATHREPEKAAASFRAM